MKETFEDISSEKTFSAAYRFPNPTEERRYCNYYLKEHSQMMYIIYAVVFIVNLSLVFRVAFDEGWHYALVPIIINQILVLVMFQIIKQQSAFYNLLSGIINVAFSVEVYCYEMRFSSHSLNNYYQLCGFLIFAAHSNLMLSSQLLYDGLGFLLSFLIYSYQLSQVNRIAEIFLLWSVILLSFYQKFQHHKFTRILYLSMQQQQEWIEVIQNVLPSAVISISNSIHNSNDPTNKNNPKININNQSTSSLQSSHLLSNWTLNLANQQSKLAYQIKDMKSFKTFANCVLVDTRELIHEGIAQMPEINPLNGPESSNFSKSQRYSTVKLDKQVENIDGFNQFSLGSAFQEKPQINNISTTVNKKNINNSNSTFVQQSHNNLNVTAEKPSIVISNNLNNNNSLTISTGLNGNQRKLSLKQKTLPAQISSDMSQQNMKKNVLLTTLSPPSLQIPELKVNNNSSEHLKQFLNPSSGQGQGASSAGMIQQNSTAELGQQLATTMAVGNNGAGGGMLPFMNDKSSQLGTENILGGGNTIRFHSTMSMNAGDLNNNQQITLFKQLQWMYDDWELTKEQPSEKNKLFIWKFNGKYYPKLLQEVKSDDNVNNEQHNETNKGELAGINKRLEKLKGELSINNTMTKKETQQDKKQEGEEEVIAVQIKVCGFRGRKTRLVLCVDDISISEKIQLCRSQDKYKDLILANVAHDLRQPLNTLGFTIAEAKEQLLKFYNIPEHSQEMQNIIELLEMADVSRSSLKYLINDILDHAKLKEGKLQVNFGQCSLLKITQFTQKMFEFAFKERSIKYRILNKTNIDQIFTDQQRLQQIILNLLSNAIKFTPANKYIILQITKVHKLIRDKQVSLLKIMVMDQGCGMSQEQLNQIFAPYVSFNHQNLNIEGIGLGLHICKSIIGLLGPFPKLYVKSKLKQGTKFFFYIYHQFRKSQRNQVKNSPSPVSVPPVVKINGFGDEGVKTPKLPGISDPSSEEKQNKQEKTDDFNKNKNYNPENHLKQNDDDITDKKDGQWLELSGLNDVVEKKRAMSIVEREEKETSSLSFQGDNNSQQDEGDDDEEEEDQNSELNMTSLVMQLPDIDENEDNYQADQDHEDMSRSNLIEKYKQNGEINHPITVLNTNRPTIDITHRTYSDVTYDNPLNQMPFNTGHDRKETNQHLLRYNSNNLDISDISSNQLTHTIIHKTNDYVEDDHLYQNSSFSIKPNHVTHDDLTNKSNKLIPLDKYILNSQPNQTTPTHRFDFNTEGQQVQSSMNQKQYADNTSSSTAGKQHINSQSGLFKIVSTTSKPLSHPQFQRQSSFPKRILVSSQPTQPQQHQIPITSISSNTNNSLYSFGNPKISSLNATQKSASHENEEANQQQPSILKIGEIQKNQFTSISSNQQINNNSSGNSKSNNDSKTNSKSNTNSNGSKIREMPFMSRRESSCSGSLIQVQKEELQVLIADDDSYSIQILKMMLKKSGQFSFITKDVFNGSDSLKEFMHRNKPESKKPFVLVITDINMPIMNGIEATNKMRKAIAEQKCHTAVFMGISGIDQDRIAADPQMSAQYKVFDVVLSKPLKEQAIINAINQNFLGFY